MISTKKKLFIGCFISAAALAVGCFFIQNENENAQSRPDRHLTNVDISEDIDLLLYTFENGYAGKKVLGDAYSKAVVKLKELKTKFPEGLSSQDFYEEVSAILQTIPDGHLRSIQNQELSLVKLILAVLASIPTDPAIKEVSFKNKKILKLTIPTFMIADRAVISDFTTELSEKMSKTDGLIIDLRGNQGGYPLLGMQVASLLWGIDYREDHDIQYFPMPIKTAVQLENKVADSLTTSLYAAHISNLTVKNRQIACAEPKIVKPSGSPDFSASTWEDHNIYEDEEMDVKNKGFARPIYILVDNECASSCERFLEAMEAHPNAKTIGQTTAGATRFGGLGLLTLTNSKIMVFIATSYLTYKDGRENERIGYKPNILISEKNDSFKEALNLITKTQTE